MELKLCWVFLIILPTGFSQGDPVTSDGNKTLISTNSSAPTFTTHSNELRICSDEDPVSKRHCKCNSAVVSCNFKDFSLTEALGNVTEDHTEFELYGFQYPLNATRFCLCNTPPNLHLKFTKKHFLPQPNKFQRFDLYNLAGTTHLNGGFYENFIGDLVISNVALIPEIHSFEFGRGLDDIGSIQHQSEDCCSPVVLREDYVKPVLFMDNSTVEHIDTRGINDNHLWRTVVMKSLKMRNIERQGIIFDSHSVRNIAVLGCKFENVSAQGIELVGSEDLILAKNLFKPTCHADAIEGYSDLNDSNAVLIGNKFLNEVCMDFDATNLVIHHNFFDLWDNFTFKAMEFSFHNASKSTSIEYNSIDVVTLKEEIGINIRGNLRLRDNIIGDCNCSTMHEIRDKQIDTHRNWCYAGRVRDAFKEKLKCSVKLSYALEQCKGSNDVVDFNKLCGKPDGHSVVEGLATVERDKTGILLGIKSNFLKMILEDFGTMLDLKKVKLDSHSGKNPFVDQDDEEKPDKISDSSKSSKKQKHSSTTAIIVVVSLLALVMVVAAVLIYRNRRRLLYRFNDRGYTQQDNLEGSREVMM